MSAPIDFTSLPPGTGLQITTTKGAVIRLWVVGDSTSHRYGPCIEVKIEDAGHLGFEPRRVLVMQVASLEGTDPAKVDSATFKNTAVRLLEPGVHVVLDDHATEGSARPLEVAAVEVIAAT